MMENLSSIPVVESISTPIGFLMNLVYIVVGGIFGIYVVSFIYNVIMGLKMKRKMKHIQDDISDIKLHLNKLENLIVNQNIVNENLKNKITIKNSLKSNKKSKNKNSLKQKKV
jgi:hypothetical protein